MRDWVREHRQIERDQLDELIAANEEMHGPLTQEEIDAAEREMSGEGQGDRAAV
ncbi:hypothetical protein [Streptomyces sp. MB09-02B]|uniref:hypothetical protein n=1 Tax=Streptomyces sp. MB09-02B TaxID=3028667 RepID=UPI0029A02B03|nr:hypothetical protein [Streptomyces sp. MB09-02B]MDX3640106.1 hypothetical protein [Streptomyces sp. MB09-02B]